MNSPGVIGFFDDIIFEIIELVLQVPAHILWNYFASKDLEEMTKFQKNHCFYSNWLHRYGHPMFAVTILYCLYWWAIVVCDYKMIWLQISFGKSFWQCASLKRPICNKYLFNFQIHPIQIDQWYFQGSNWEVLLIGQGEGSFRWHPSCLFSKHWWMSWLLGDIVVFGHQS